MKIRFSKQIQEFYLEKMMCDWLENSCSEYFNRKVGKKNMFSEVAKFRTI